jgi:hypothetical protein
MDRVLPDMDRYWSGGVHMNEDGRWQKQRDYLGTCKTRKKF